MSRRAATRPSEPARVRPTHPAILDPAHRSGGYRPAAPGTDSWHVAAARAAAAAARAAGPPGRSSAPRGPCTPAFATKRAATRRAGAKAAGQAGAAPPPLPPPAHTGPSGSLGGVWHHDHLLGFRDSEAHAEASSSCAGSAALPPCVNLAPAAAVLSQAAAAGLPGRRASSRAGGGPSRVPSVSSPLSLLAVRVAEAGPGEATRSAPGAGAGGAARRRPHNERCEPEVDGGYGPPGPITSLARSGSFNGKVLSLTYQSSALIATRPAC